MTDSEDEGSQDSGNISQDVVSLKASMEVLTKKMTQITAILIFTGTGPNTRTTLTTTSTGPNTGTAIVLTGNTNISNTRGVATSTTGC